MPQILLSTLNARYIHASLGLRYLKANMDELDSETVICEFTINQRADFIAESILALEPVIVGFGVYIWNCEETHRVVALLKTLRPDLIIILGGPEVSYEHQEQPLVALADYLITGQADLAFARLCRQILGDKPVAEKIIDAHPEPLPFLKLPYAHYSDEDIRNRVLYVEASRGCPFKCEFCLSALDKTATPFDLNEFLEQMQNLYDRGACHFKFVDRTFNLKIANSLRILEFFLDKLQERELFLHFELIPDRLPEELKAVLPRFPAGSLQFEIGVQSFNPDVQQSISRKQDNEKTANNLTWIRQNTHAHIHADLIFGLPGETLQSFASGFNKLYQLKPHEIQLGILKRLRGTPIIRHTSDFDMRYNPAPPYNILSTSVIEFPLMQRFTRFARYWDLIANSGRFGKTLPVIMGEAPFDNFFRLTDSIYAQSGQTHRIALRKLFDYLYLAMTGPLGISPEHATAILEEDFANSGQKGFFRPPQLAADNPLSSGSAKSGSRQRRHRAQP